MAYEHQEGSGSLFVNDRKSADNHPDYKGQVKINGKLMDVAAWKKNGTRGEFFSIKISEPRQQQGQRTPHQQSALEAARIGTERHGGGAKRPEPMRPQMRPQGDDAPF